MPHCLKPDDLKARPLERASTLPASCYRDVDLHHWERDDLLARHWQLIAHRSEIARPGGFLPVEVLGRPLLVVNDGGNLRLFHNVCRHRAGPLATCPGQGSHLRCQYHGWVYSLDGRLKAAPRFEGVEDFEPEGVRLESVRLAEWGGFLFADLSSGAGRIEDKMGDISKGCQTLLKSGMMLRRRATFDLACNWKLYVDNFLESYHVPLVHPSFNGILDSSATAIETHGRASVQRAPITDTGGAYGQEPGEAQYWFVFPNLMFNVVPGRVQTNIVQPLGVDRCRVVFEWYSDATLDEEQLERDIAFSAEVQEEDRRICEAVQRGIAGGSWQSGRFSVSQEAAVHHFHELMRQAYREAGVDNPTSR